LLALNALLKERFEDREQGLRFFEGKCAFGHDSLF
jgi:hypothetical protein